MYSLAMTRKALSTDEIRHFREAYCDIAYALYQQHDFHAVSMRGIAKEMGCSPMTAYRYFKNKEEVFGFLRAILFDRLADALETVDTQSNPKEYMQALGQAYVNFALDEPFAYRLLYMIHLHQSQANSEIERAQNRTKKVLFNATISLIDVGVVKGDAVVIAHGLWGVIHGLVSLHLANNLNQGASLDELLPNILEIFLQNGSHKNQSQMRG